MLCLHYSCLSLVINMVHICSLLSVDELLDDNIVEHSEQDHLATEGSKEPSSMEFEKHYDMLHDIEREKDVYRLGVSIQ